MRPATHPALPFSAARGKRRIPDRAHHPPAVPRRLRQHPFRPAPQRDTHGAHDRGPERQHVRHVGLVHAAEALRARGPLVEAAQEGVRRAAGGGDILPIPIPSPIHLLIRSSRRAAAAKMRFPGPDRPIPVDALVPIALPLRDVVANHLVPAGAVAVGITDIAPADALLLGVGDGGEEAAGEVEDRGGERGGQVVVGEVEEARGGAGGVEGASAGLEGGRVDRVGGEEGGDVDDWEGGGWWGHLGGEMGAFYIAASDWRYIWVKTFTSL